MRTTATGLALTALTGVIATAMAAEAPPGPTPSRNKALEDLLTDALNTDTAAARINIADGAFVEREWWFGAVPNRCFITHRAIVELIVTGPDDGDREAVFDNLLALISDALAADRTLGGVVDFADVDSIGDLEESALEGVPQTKSSLVGVILQFASNREV